MSDYQTYQSQYTQQTAAPNDGCLDWEGEIQAEGGEFPVLDPGIYPFTVTKFARGRFTPGPNSKLPACNQALVTLRVGDLELEEKFPLHAKMEWKISGLYAALGMKGQGERVRMNWPAIQGRSGYLELEIHTWTGNDGRERRSNRIARFLAPWDKDYPAAAAQNAAPAWGGQPAQQQTISGYQTHASPWEPGKF